MVLDRLAHFLFVFYCSTVGVVLLLLPWSSGWETMLMHLPTLARSALESMWLRGAVSGFGLVHLVWSAYDLRSFVYPDAARDQP